MNRLKIISVFVLFIAQPVVARSFIILESNSPSCTSYHFIDFGDNKITNADLTIDSSKTDHWPGRFRLFIITNNSFDYTIMLKDSCAFSIKNYVSIQKNMVLNSYDFIPNPKRTQEICDSLGKLNLPYYKSYNFSSKFTYRFDFVVKSDRTNTGSNQSVRNLDSLQQIFNSFSKDYEFFVFPCISRPKSDEMLDIIAFSNNQRMKNKIFSRAYYKIVSEIKVNYNTPMIFWPVPCSTN